MAGTPSRSTGRGINYRRTNHDHTPYGHRCGVRSAVSARLSRAHAAQTPGVTAMEIKIGNTMPYSGPASSYSVIGRTETAFFNMVNDQGGVAGRKIDFISPNFHSLARKTYSDQCLRFLRHHTLRGW
jgi:hypothetical protein